MKKVILVVLVLVVLLVSAWILRSTLSEKTPATPSSTDALTMGTDSSSPMQGDTVKQEEVEAEESQGVQDVSSLFSENGDEIETIDVSDEEIIDIGETEAVGGM